VDRTARCPGPHLGGESFHPLVFLRFAFFKMTFETERIRSEIVAIGSNTWLLANRSRMIGNQQMEIESMATRRRYA